MAEYLHGAYGKIDVVGSRIADKSLGAIVYVGTAPVHTVKGGASNVNVPIVINNMAEAYKYLGYSTDWASYTLCEAMKAHFVNNSVGPVVFINVLDPSKHKATSATTVSKTANNGTVVITGAQNIILDSVSVKAGSVSFTKDKDYTISYNVEKERIDIAEATNGALGTAALSISYETVDPSKVTTADVIGATDGTGLNTGIYAIANVYSLTGYVPSFFLCPGFSSDKTVHQAMYANSRKVNGHWDVFMFTDLPLTNEDEAVTLATAATVKKTNGYTYENEKVFFPMVLGTDGYKYHISVLNAANFQKLLVENDGIPYKSASNTECAIIANLYLGEDYKNRVYDDKVINDNLCQNGISSAAYVGGRWAIWGAHCADYNQDDASAINIAETNRMMLYYVSNDFQERRMGDVDTPLTMNDLNTIVAEEQTRLDALLNIGALTYGTAELNAESITESDVMSGDYSFTFNVTTTPLAKSLTALVAWTNEGFKTYFESDTVAA